MQLVGVCTFASDPSQDYDCAVPIWSAALDPQVIRARAHPCRPNMPLCLTISRYAHRVAISAVAEHLLIWTGNTSLRLDIVEGTAFEGPVMLEPCVTLEKLELQISGLRKLDAMLREVQPPPEKDPRLSRLILALRALDGRAEGASLRDLAFGIFGASDWPGDGDYIKSRTRRLVALAAKLQRAGPRGVLARHV